MLKLRFNKLGRVSTMAAAAIVLFTGCSFSPPDPASDRRLVSTCETLRVNLRPLETVELLDRKLYYDGESVAMLLGTQTRTNNRDFIYRTFPFMKQYTIEGIARGDYESGVNDYRIQLALEFLGKTQTPIEITDEDLRRIEENPETAYEEVVEPKLERIIGEPYKSEGCNGIDSSNDVEYGDRVGELYTDAIAAAEESKTHLLGILLCERDGEIEGTPCDTEDFDSSSIASSDFCETQELSITNNDNEPGVSCGTLRFDIFQADQNTGDCMALGYWNDRNGVEQVGAFFGCGFEEGLSYEEAVVVGNPYTYTNTFGTENTVVSFSLN